MYTGKLDNCECKHFELSTSCMDHLNAENRGRPWRYSVIPSTPEIPEESQIRRNSNPAGLPVFAAIWGPDFRAGTIILTHMFKQIKQIRIAFKVNPTSPNDVR